MQCHSEWRHSVQYDHTEYNWAIYGFVYKCNAMCVPRGSRFKWPEGRKKYNERQRESTNTEADRTEKKTKQKLYKQVIYKKRDCGERICHIYTASQLHTFDRHVGRCDHILNSRIRVYFIKLIAHHIDVLHRQFCSRRIFNSIRDESSRREMKCSIMALVMWLENAHPNLFSPRQHVRIGFVVHDMHCIVICARMFNATYFHYCYPEQ